MVHSFEHIQDEIAAMLSIPDDELTCEQRGMMDDYLNEIASQEAEKVDGFAQFIKLQTALMEACKEESQRLANKARTAGNRIAWLKNKYLAIMQNNGLKKVSGHVYALSVRASEAVAVTENQEELGRLAETEPLYFARVESIKSDKKAIKEAIKGGHAIPGCELVTNFSLNIR